MKAPDTIQDVDLLSGIPPEFITERFRSAIAKVVTVRQNLQDGIRKASDGAAAAAAAGDVVAEASARSLLRELEALHAPDLDPNIAGEALQLASRQVDALVQLLPLPPTSTYLYELAAYDSLPIDVRTTGKVWSTGQVVVRPLPGPSDAGAWQAGKDLMAQHASVSTTIAAWRSSLSQVGLDCARVINHIRTAMGCVELARQYQARHAEVVALVKKADAEHSRFGLTWKPPYGISTPAIEALARRS